MKLLFLRHAIAEDATPGMRDGDRALTEEGRVQVPLVANALQLLGTVPDIVLSSPLARAKETAELLAPLLGCRVEFVDEFRPGNGSLEDLQRVLRRYTANTIMIVGHEPDLASLVARLANADERGILIKKAGLVRVDIDGRVQEGRGHLVWLLTPKVMGFIRKDEHVPDPA